MKLSRGEVEQRGDAVSDLDGLKSESELVFCRILTDSSADDFSVGPCPPPEQGRGR